MVRRILLVSYANYLDDANGAAVASRAMMENLARRGFAVEVLCGPLLEIGREIDLCSAMTAQGLSVEIQKSEVCVLGSATTPITPKCLRLVVSGVPVSILAGSSMPREPEFEECQAFLALFDRVCKTFGPEVMVTYGGGWLTREIVRQSSLYGAATVFSLHNLRYSDPATFADVDSVLVASRFAADHYRKTLGLSCTVLPNLVDHRRVRAQNRQPSYVVLVNPTIEKGVSIFARIADELGRRRPDIPFLVVEGRGTEQDVAACGLELRSHGNVFFHEHTNDPRRFWRVAKLCLLPSLVPENQPLVAIEAMINGVPVIGSDRGGVPETLGKAGSIISIPPRLTSATPWLPTPAEVSPWVDAIMSLWDSPQVYEWHSRAASIEAGRWAPESIEPLYEHFFATIGRCHD
ncbi:MAG: glycosyltransferase family 4 protein [Isosphaeraceae bacterium]